MKKNAILFSAGEYLDSKTYPKPSIDLSGVKYDIIALEKRLKQIGFNVVKKENVEKAEYIPTLQQCANNSPNDAIHIVYFSGHGGHANGENFIYPSDFGVQYDLTNDVAKASINIRDIISVFKNKGRLILILDSCRNDFNFSKGYYSEMTSAENVYIAYGTMFQDTSTGVKNQVSWFTEAICDEILTPNIDVDTLFTNVRMNIFTKHYIQIPPSVNALLDKVILHSEQQYTDIDKQVYDFIEKYASEYEDKYGYFQGEYLVFIDAAQYFDIGLLDAYWHYSKVQIKLAEEQGIKMPKLSEDEQKIVDFLHFPISPNRFSFNISHTWYYKGRQIRMGEIPPLPVSMQQELPEQGKEICVNFEAKKEEGVIILETNLPDKSEIMVKANTSICSQKMKVLDGKIIMNNANDVLEIIITAGVFSDDEDVQQMLGKKCRNLVGKFVEYHPIYGNQLHAIFEF